MATIPTVTNFDLNKIPIEGTPDFRTNASYVWSTIPSVITSMNNSILEMNNFSSYIENVVPANVQEARAQADIATEKALEASISLEKTNAFATMARNSEINASNHAQDVINTANSIDNTAYALTQIGINLSAVVDGELIMQYNDPVSNISLNSDNELIIEF